MTHIPMVIRKMGPPRSFWAMQYKSKHGYFKDLARKLRNIKDICSTLLTPAAHAGISNTLPLTSNAPVLLKPTLDVLSNVEHHELISSTLKIRSEEKLFFGKSVKLGHYYIYLDKFICIDVSKTLPIFGQVLLLFSTKGICERTISYCVEKDTIPRIVKCNDRQYPKSFN